MSIFDHSVRFLDLPALDPDLVQQILVLAEKIPPDLSSIEWLEHLHENNIRAVSQIYARDMAVFPKDLHDKISQLYQPYFSIPVVPIFGIFENIYKDSAAECPPHCDRQRQTAINYIITAGGPNVQTCFYHDRRQNLSLESAENALHRDVSLDFKVTLPEQIWHAYCVQTYHSVENIQTKRIILSLYLENNLSYNNFTKLYDHLMYE